MLERGRYFGEHQQLNSWTAIGRSHPSRTLGKYRENQVAESEWMDGVISGSNLLVTEALATRQSLKSPYSEAQPVLLAAWPSYTGSLGSEAASWSPIILCVLYVLCQTPTSTEPHGNPSGQPCQLNSEHLYPGPPSLPPPVSNLHKP